MSFVFHYDPENKVLTATSDLMSFYIHITATDPNDNVEDGNTLYERAWVDQKLFVHGLAKNLDKGLGSFQSGLHDKVGGRQRFDTDGPEIDIADPRFTLEDEFIVIDVDQMQIKIINTPEHREGLSNELKKMLDEIEWVCTYEWFEEELREIENAT